MRRRRIGDIVVSSRRGFVATGEGRLLLVWMGARQRVGRGRASRRDILVIVRGACDSGTAPGGGPMLAAWRARWLESQLIVVDGEEQDGIEMDRR